MRKNQSLKRLGVTALTMGLLGVGVLPSNSYADEGNITKVQSKSSNKTKEGRVLSYNDAVESNEFLTDKEVKSINLSALNAIYKEMKNIADSKSEEELNQIVAEKIKNNPSVSFRSAYSLQIPGFGTLTDAEVDLAKKNPFEFVTYGACSVLAKTTSEKYYSNSTLYQGNGDAFRHSFWNAALAKELGTIKGRDVGVARAKVWTDAHEQYSSGVDKEMDLYNNEVGRTIAYNNYSWSITQYSSHIRNEVANGSMVRIVEDKLVRTNGYL
ncbi:DUF6973 domain-containing protein [Bacillus wiedmannii]|uniref:DUF6973 domain-containing protein n=1 Tax=Bacillus wiedmannii TaxID=1890302 RepID=UPI000BEF9993|nr:hypothetical protein [Bacillus wiedmannii]PEL82824.1 hypothetical protein CN609_09385 [Bacillus wiedmannii]